MNKTTNKNTPNTPVTTISASDIVSALSSATDFDNRSAIHRNKVLNTLRDKGVTFTDIQPALIKVYKDAGVYKKSFIGGKMKYEPFATLLQKRTKWAHDIRRFMAYVKKTYVSYDKLKADVPKKIKDESEDKGKYIVRIWTPLQP